MMVTIHVSFGDRRLKKERDKGRHKERNLLPHDKEEQLEDNHKVKVL